MKIRRWPRGTVKLLRQTIDVYQCPLCGLTEAHNCDTETFSGPGVLDCSRCGHHTMNSWRYSRDPASPDSGSDEGGRP